jgi:hypothetical protein
VSLCVFRAPLHQSNKIWRTFDDHKLFSRDDSQNLITRFQIFGRTKKGPSPPAPHKKISLEKERGETFNHMWWQTMSERGSMKKKEGLSSEEIENAFE